MDNKLLLEIPLRCPGCEGEFRFAAAGGIEHTLPECSLIEEIGPIEYVARAAALTVASSPKLANKTDIHCPRCGVKQQVVNFAIGGLRRPDGTQLTGCDKCGWKSGSGEYPP